MARIYHVVNGDYFSEGLGTGLYRGSTRGRSLDEEGFIHCARSHQLADVVDRYYGADAEIVLFEIDTDRLTSPLQDDAAGDDVYPHIYGPLNMDAVVKIGKQRRGPGGFDVASWLDRLGPEG